MTSICHFQTAASVLAHRLPRSAKPPSRILPQGGIKMHVGEIMTADCANGIGMRVTVFVSGCRNHCPGCFQPETWDFEYGKLYTLEMENEIIKELSHPYYDGLTLLGGDPMEESNQEGLLPLLQRIRRELPEKNIWAYTGYLYDKDLVPGGRKHVDCPRSAE